MNLGERIKKQREKLSLTQTELAGKIQVSPQVISNWERGYSFPDTGDLIRLSLTFKVSTDYLLRGIYTEEMMSVDIKDWLEFGIRLKEEGYDLLKLQEMIIKIKESMKF